MTQSPLSNDISIVLGGEAGQGIQTIEELLTKILKLEGYYVYATKEYMSRVRGGTNTTSIRVASERVRAPVRRIDLLVPLDKGVIPHVRSRISDQTFIVGDKEMLDTDCKVVHIPFSQMSKDFGSEVYSNTIALGLILGLLKIDDQSLEKYLIKRFIKKGEDIVANNIKAVRAGYEKGLSLLKRGDAVFSDITRSDTKDEIMVNGTEAVALGAIAGGCRCVTSYPMTPGTGVITSMARQAHEFDLLVEQAEDEIAAINMALGAWYAGARAMVTTSGGGFALMTEGLSLAGMLELPVVVHLAQRPGPATGLPTRTEQGDLELALYAGHGVFPRIILAPESTGDAFYLTHKAFNLADRYQVPVIVLTDQYLIDTYYNTKAFDLSGLEIENYIVKTAEDYRRYKLTEDGISPRGIPAEGSGFVCVDSDEHDEDGHITEDLDLRIRMVDKRLRKLDRIREDVSSVKIYGQKNYSTLVLSWGSTNLIVREALSGLGRDDLASAAIRQVYPLSPELNQYLAKAERTIIVENNATCQLGRIILRETGYHIDYKILKYNGLPFTVEEIMESLAEYIQVSTVPRRN